MGVIPIVVAVLVIYNTTAEQIARRENFAFWVRLSEGFSLNSLFCLFCHELPMDFSFFSFFLRLRFSKISLFHKIAVVRVCARINNEFLIAQTALF